MKRFLLFAVALLGIYNAKAQYYYNPQATGKNPGALNSDAEFPEGSGLSAGWTKIDAGSASSARWSSNQTIPFAFKFNGATVTEFKVSTSGILTFDVSAPAAPSYTKAALPNASIPDNSVCIWGLAGLGSNDFIFTKTFGTGNNRQHWIHFNSYSYSSLASDGSNFTYWAIVLEESTNKIYIVDQRTGGYATTAKQVSAGIQINSTTAISVSGSPNLQSKAGTSETPSDNEYYEFLPGDRPMFDLAGTGITLNTNLALPQAPFQIKGSLKNNGATTITSFTINYTVNGGAAVSVPITGVSITTNSSYLFTHTTGWSPSAAGNYTIETYATALNGSNADEDLTNDKSSLIVKVWDNFVDRKPLHEIFTSSTCPPCAPGNTNMKGVLGGQTGKYTVLKYQTNFPGTGDPYYTAEVGTRFSYYGANYAPWLTVDGSSTWNNGATDPNANSYTLATYQKFQSNPAFVTITPSLNVTGNTVTVTGSINPIQNISGNLRLHVAIAEKVTYLNKKTNGENEFYYVMKKMLPNASGTTLSNLTSGTPVAINQTFTFPGTYRLPTNGQAANIINLATEHSVEDFKDLVAVVFIQDNTTKEIIQSAWTAPSWALGDQPIPSNLKGINVYPNPANGQFTVDFTETSLTSSVQINVIDITGKVMFSKDLGFENPASTLDVDCSHFAKGLYFVEISNGISKSVHKVMVQ